MANPLQLEDLLNWREFLSSLGEDEDLAREILGVYQEESPAYVANVEEARRLGDLNELARAAHRHKGALATIHATKAAEQARLLEDACRSNRPLMVAQAADALQRELSCLGPALDTWLRDPQI